LSDILCKCQNLIRTEPVLFQTELRTDGSFSSSVPSQLRQAYFGLIVFSANILWGIICSFSLVSSPILLNSVPQAQNFSASFISITFLLLVIGGYWLPAAFLPAMRLNFYLCCVFLVMGCRFFRPLFGACLSRLLAKAFFCLV